jgi:hypothetical protein
VTYRNILETQLSEKNAITNQIELDLHRTLPNNKLFEKDEGLNKLRNILVAFSWINTEVGYCQSMNFWAAFLLLFTDEEVRPHSIVIFLRLRCVSHQLLFTTVCILVNKGNSRNSASQGLLHE